MENSRPPLFDFAATLKRQARATADAFLRLAAAEGVADRLAPVKRAFARGLFIGEAVPKQLAGFAQSWTLADFDGKEILGAAPESFELAVSLFSLQNINDLAGALIQIRRALKSDGLFLGVVLGGATLRELRDSFAHAESETLGGITPRVAPFGDVRDLGGLLQRAGFALPVADVERSLLRYRDFAALARDLREAGMTNAMAERSRKFLRRDTLAALLSHYAGHHGEGGRLSATFEMIYLTGWAPHESQQQPLKPGSAKARLADALGVPERKI